MTGKSLEAASCSTLLTLSSIHHKALVTINGMGNCLVACQMLVGKHSVAC